MFDLKDFDSYKENNRIELKRANSELPNSVWESYSAFANSDGGVIILGVKEKANKAFEISNIEDSGKMLKSFWDTINNRNKISRNLLRESSVYTQEIDGKTIIVIEVPRAMREQRPVYVGQNMFTGSYRRNWEGDYLMSKEEVAAMFRDAGDVTQDKKILLEMDETVFCPDSIKGYRQVFAVHHDNHIWNKLSDQDFLCRIGAAAFDENGKLHPTCAGLLMFGWEYEIVREFPNYFLDYQEHFDASLRWSDRVISSSGDWSGNIFDFFYKISAKLEDGIKRPFKMEGIFRIDDTPAHKAVREALVNCLVHGDYYGRQGTVIKKYAEKIVFSNPGNFRIPVSEAMNGGISDPRNSVLLKLFSFLELGERAGSGVPKIIDALEESFGTKPSYTEKKDPARTEMVFWLEDFVKKNYPENLDTTQKNKENYPENLDTTQKTEENYPKNSETTQKNKENYPENLDTTQKTEENYPENSNTTQKTEETAQDDSLDNNRTSSKILKLMKENPRITREELSEKIGITPDGIKYQIKLLREKGLINREGGDKGGRWKLRSLETSPTARCENAQVNNE